MSSHLETCFPTTKKDLEKIVKNVREVKPREFLRQDSGAGRRQTELPAEADGSFKLFCEKIRSIDDSILSLTIADKAGNLLAHSYGSEYQEKFMESAGTLRSKAGAIAALSMGMETQADSVFGATEAIVKLHTNAKLIVIPFPSKNYFLTLLAKRHTDTDSIIQRVADLSEFKEFDSAKGGGKL